MQPKILINRWTGSATNLRKVMATKIRLARGGKKRKPIYSIVVADARSPRDGKYIEKLGSFNPNVEPPTIQLNFDSAFDWVMKGAEPTETTRKLLSTKGVMLKKHLQVGVNKGAIKQEEADKKFDAWVADKDKEAAKLAADNQKAAEAAAKKAAAAREKIKTDAAEAEAKAEAEALAAAAAEAKAAEEAENATEEVVEEAPAEEAAPEAATEEAPAAEAPAEEAKEEEKAAE